VSARPGSYDTGDASGPSHLNETDLETLDELRRLGYVE
jgi:hypothetical protein